MPLLRFDGWFCLFPPSPHLPCSPTPLLPITTDTPSPHDADLSAVVLTKEEGVCPISPAAVSRLTFRIAATMLRSEDAALTVGWLLCLSFTTPHSGVSIRLHLPWW